MRGLKRPGRSSSFAHADRLPYFHGLRWRRAPCMTAVAFRLACEGERNGGTFFLEFLGEGWGTAGSGNARTKGHRPLSMQAGGGQGSPRYSAGSSRISSRP